MVRQRRNYSTLLMVFSARVETFTCTNRCSASEKNRLLWILGSHDRRVLCMECGTLLPYCFILPWNRPSWDRLNGVLTISLSSGEEKNMTGRMRSGEGEDASGRHTSLKWQLVLQLADNHSTLYYF